jgi:hypothetical protein
MSIRRRSRPSRAAMNDAEADLRTLAAYVGVLQGRLALARVSRRRAALASVTDGDLALLTIQCERATAAVDAVLGRMSPELASNAAAIADAEHRRAFTRPRPPAAAHLQLVEADHSA